MRSERVQAIAVGILATAFMVAIVASGASPRARRSEPLAAAVRSVATDPACCIGPDDEARLQSLSLHDFDQDLVGQGGGWRRYGQELGCYRAGAELIERYSATHREISADDRINLRWHAGQLYGFAGEAALARANFVASLNPNEAPDWPVLWNDYVIATIAFLDGDSATLRAHRDRVARGPELHGKKPNLSVLDRLIEHLGRPYAEAYGVTTPARECPSGR